MSLIEIAKMACLNLWVRKLRTALNVFGIVVSCTLLLCTLAATTGIKNAVHKFISESDEARRIRIFPDHDRSVDPPEEAVHVDPAVPERRRKRIRKVLEEKWRNENQRDNYRIPLSKIETIAKMKHVVEVHPHFRAAALVAINGKELDGQIESMSYHDSELERRIIFGKYLNRDAPESLLISEYFAFQFGYETDQQLESLIGKEVTLQFRTVRNLFSFLGNDFFRQGIADQGKWISIFDHLISGKGFESLDSESKQMVRDFVQSRVEKKEPQVKTITRKFRIAGIYRPRDEDDPVNFLNRYMGGGDSGLLTHHSFLREMHEMSDRKNGFFNGEVYVDSSESVEAVSDTLRKEGVTALATSSMLGHITYTINRARTAVSISVAVILLISAVGITNTMIISLVERTQEIGIMKAVGASNRQVLCMILFEGLITGLFAAFVATIVSFFVAVIGSEILKGYVSGRVQMEFSENLFSIQYWMIGLTFLVSIFVTTFAGLWPAWKAARMEPVTAISKTG